MRLPCCNGSQLWAKPLLGACKNLNSQLSSRTHPCQPELTIVILSASEGSRGPSCEILHYHSGLQPSVGADLSCPPPIYRPFVPFTISHIYCSSTLSTHTTHPIHLFIRTKKSHVFPFADPPTCRLTHKFAKKGIYASETGVGACNACLCIISTF